jgi:hypothetical protein
VRTTQPRLVGIGLGPVGSIILSACRRPTSPASTAPPAAAPPGGVHNPSNIRGGTQPEERAVAEALRQSSARVGITSQLRPFPGVGDAPYRPPNLSNAYITNGFQMYDYVSLGTTRR